MTVSSSRRRFLNTTLGVSAMALTATPFITQAGAATATTSSASSTADSSDMLTIALGQLAVADQWQDNAAQCSRLIQQAAQQGADLLIMPEAILAADIGDPECVRRSAQPLDGPFMQQMLKATLQVPLTVVFTLYVPADAQRVGNVQVALRQGRIVATYHKLHLYDAFTMQESQSVEPGKTLPPIFDVAGMKVGMMTCYDLRFPEEAKSLALRGAELIVLPAAWVRGPNKERHWEALIAARALDTTCFVAAVSECGPHTIGCSMVADPMGLVVARAGETPTLVTTRISRQRLAQARKALPVLTNGRFKAPELA